MFVFNILKVFFYMRVSFHTVIVLLLSCGVYSGSIWEWKFLNYRETVRRLFRNEERNIKASSQNICKCWLQQYTESADDAVQVFASEWCPACYVCWTNDTSYVKMVWEVLYTSQQYSFACVFENTFGKFFTINHQSTKHQRKPCMLQLAQNCFAAERLK